VIRDTPFVLLDIKKRGSKLGEIPLVNPFASCPSSRYVWGQRMPLRASWRVVRGG